MTPRSSASLAVSRRRRPWRPMVLVLALASVTAFLVWNGIFGLHISRGEKQYLLEEARYRLGERDAPSLPVIMEDTVRAGATEATRWAVVVFVVSAAAGIRPR